jgi:hypothetical protein
MSSSPARSVDVGPKVATTPDRALLLSPRSKRAPAGTRHDCSRSRARSGGAIAKPRAQQSRRARRDDCIARAMRKPDRTKFPAVAALLLSSDLRLLVRHDCDRPLAGPRNDRSRSHMLKRSLPRLSPDSCTAAWSACRSTGSPARETWFPFTARTGHREQPGGRADPLSLGGITLDSKHVCPARRHLRGRR